MMEDLFVLVFIVLVASFLQASTGFGFSIIGTPFLLAIYPVHEAIQINIILSIFLSVFMILKIKNELDKILLQMLIKGSAIGMVGGIFIYLLIDVRWLKFSVGTLVLMLTVLLVLKFSIKRTNKKDIIVGGVSGLLTTSIGVPGPPLLLYFSSAKIDKYTLRSTTLAYYLFVYTGSLLMQIIFGGTSITIWKNSLTAIPALFAGILMGQLLINRISQRTFRVITCVILIFTGIYLIITSF